MAQEVRQKFDLDVAGTVSGLERVAQLAEKLDGELNSTGDGFRDSMRGAEAAARDFNRELADGTKIYRKIENSAKGFKQEQERLKAVYTDLTKRQKEFIAAGRYEELQKNIAGVKARIKELGGTLDDTGKKTDKFTKESGTNFKKIAGYIAGAFSVGLILDWGRQAGQAILNVTAEFQKFEAVLTTSLGSGSAAERALLMIQDFAAKTPFSVQELTDAYVKLASRGIRATSKELNALGDLASSTGKSFDQLTEAVLDAMSGENERLKEFGITAKRNGETTAYTFKGVTTEVKNSADAIKDYLVSLGDVEGVTGSMANISETLTGKISNLGDTIDQLWLTIGEQETGVMASFIDFLGGAVEYTSFLIANTEQLAKKLSAEPVSEFATNTESKFRQLAEETKKSGGDVAQALEAQSAALRTSLEADLAKAEANLAKYKEKTGGVGSILSYGTNQAQYVADKAMAASIEATVVELQDKLAALSDAQRLTMEDLAKEEDKAAQERAAQAVKNAEEATKKEAAARLKALNELYKELQSLEQEAEKARLNMLDKNSRAYLEAQRKYDLEQVALIEQSIREKQRLAGLDTDLTPEQQEQLRTLALQADKKYYDALYELERQERDKLLELQKASDEKEMQQLVNKYDDQIRKAEEAGQREVAIALKTAKEREKARLGKAQAGQSLDTGEQFARELAEFTLPDGMSQVERERLLQERLLEVQIEFAEKRLALVENSLDAEDRLKALQLKNEIARLKTEQEEMKENSEGFSLQKLLGLDDEQMQAVSEAVNYSLGQLQDFLAASVEMRRKEVEALTRAIDEKGEELDREIELNKQGFASNVELKQQEYDQLKAQREKAMKDQQKAQRNQVLLDSALQVSNLITSSTEIFKVMSPIPFVGVPLAIGLIATMFGAFLAAKSKAMQAATVPTYAKGGEGTLIKGASHSQGGIDVVENRTGRRIANIEGGENFYVTNKKATDEFWPYLELINQHDKKGLLSLAFDELLAGTGVIPHPELPKKLQVAHTAAKQAQAGFPVERYYKEMTQYMKTMVSHTKPGQTVTETANYIEIRNGHNTRRIRK